ncbi:MAG TPA: hypothetical protein VFB66_24590, partial [Tepidisphaeraceae bacterium]|nr:hypothetical protein [Tepidisphaeraceae bacterium]
LLLCAGAVAAPSDKAESHRQEKLEHASSGWVIQLPKGWRKPKAYDDPSNEQHWDAQGYTHRVPPDAEPEAALAPLLILWGEPLPEKQTPEEVVKVLAGHHGFAKNSRLASGRI